MIWSCGSCQLCCRLLPVKSLGKLASERCKHQRFGKGCAIYARRPRECMVWNCRWLVDDDTSPFGLRRPDHVHYVIDVMPDFVRVTEPSSGRQEDQSVMQVWVDPQFPEAHRDPALRAYMVHIAQTRGDPTLVRWGNELAALIAPPALTGNGEWVEFPASAPVRDGSVGLEAALRRAIGEQTA